MENQNQPIDQCNQVSNTQVDTNQAQLSVRATSESASTSMMDDKDDDHSNRMDAETYLRSDSNQNDDATLQCHSNFRSIYPMNPDSTGEQSAMCNQVLSKLPTFDHEQITQLPPEGNIPQPDIDQHTIDYGQAQYQVEGSNQICLTGQQYLDPHLYQQQSSGTFELDQQQPYYRQSHISEQETHLRLQHHVDENHLNLTTLGQDQYHYQQDKNYTGFIHGHGLSNTDQNYHYPHQQQQYSNLMTGEQNNNLYEHNKSSIGYIEDENYPNQVDIPTSKTSILVQSSNESCVVVELQAQDRSGQIGEPTNVQIQSIDCHDLVDNLQPSEPIEREEIINFQATQNPQVNQQQYTTLINQTDIDNIGTPAIRQQSSIGLYGNHEVTHGSSLNNETIAFEHQHHQSTYISFQYDPDQAAHSDNSEMTTGQSYVYSFVPQNHEAGYYQNVDYHHHHNHHYNQQYHHHHQFYNNLTHFVDLNDRQRVDLETTKQKQQVVIESTTSGEKVAFTQDSIGNNSQGSHSSKSSDIINSDIDEENDNNNNSNNTNEDDDISRHNDHYDEDDDDDDDDEDEDDESSDGQMSRDERKVREENIPLSYKQIVNLSIDQFNDEMTRHQLTEKQMNLIKDIRRRGKNKVAAQSCRKRKMEQIYELQIEVDQLVNRKVNLRLECCQLKRQHEDLIQEYDRLQSIIGLVVDLNQNQTQQQQQQHYSQQVSLANQCESDDTLISNIDNLDTNGTIIIQTNRNDDCKGNLDDKNHNNNTNNRQIIVNSSCYINT